MADENDIFSQLVARSLGGGSSVSTGASDLNAFNQTIQASNPYGIAGKSLAAWNPNMSTWSGGTSGLVSFGKSFLAGLLGNVARNDAADQLSKVAAIFPQLQNDPAHTALPEGVDVGAGNTLKLSLMEKKQTNDDAIGRALATTLGVKYDPITGTVSPIQGAGVGKDLSTIISDVSQAKKAAGEKSLNPQAVQKLAAGSSILGQLNKAKEYVDQFTKNPTTGLLGEMKIPVLGDYLSELVGGTERGFQGTRNTTPEGQFNALMQSVYEGAGKFISNSARQKIIDENRILTDPGRTGSPEGIKEALQNIQDVIAEDLKDQASGYGEQHYNTVLDTINKALSYGSADPTSAPFMGDSRSLTGANGITPTPALDMAAVKEEADLLKSLGIAPAEIAATLRAKFGSQVGG